MKREKVIMELSQELNKVLKNQMSKNFAFLQLYDRFIQFTPTCRAIILAEIIKFWSIITDLITITQIDGEDSKNIFKPFLSQNYLKQTVKANLMNKGITEPFLQFYKDYTKVLREFFIERVDECIYSTNKLNEEKVEQLMRLSLEIVNIRFLELKGMKFSCKVLKNFNGFCIYSSATPCKDFNTFIIQIVPEYLYKEGTLESLGLAIIEHIKPNSIKVLFDFTNIKNRMDDEEFLRNIERFKPAIVELVNLMLKHCNKEVYGYNLLPCVKDIPFKKVFKSLNEVKEFSSW